MSDVKAPERIWAYSWSGKEGYQGQWDYVASPHYYGNVIEYVRADLYDSLAKERDELASEIGRLTEERDQALSQAAAAAMEMRERAHNAACVRRSVGEILKAIHALPIDPDAQKALDKMLAKVRKDAIREAAAVVGYYMSTEADELLLDIWREDILALINDGVRG